VETPETVYNKLLAIQVKYADYFAEYGIDIFACVHIHWEAPLRVLVIGDDLPGEIRHAIENCFD